MAYGDHKGPNKPDKGMRGGSCNRERCQAPNANFWNRGSHYWYCEDCAHTLSHDRFNAADAIQNGIHPLCIYVPPDAPAPQT